MDVSQQRTFLKCKSDPMIFKRNMSSWPAAKWNPVVLDDILGEKQLKFRMGRKNRTGKFIYKNELYNTLDTISKIFFLYFVFNFVIFFCRGMQFYITKCR